MNPCYPGLGLKINMNHNLMNHLSHSVSFELQTKKNEGKEIVSTISSTNVAKESSVVRDFSLHGNLMVDELHSYNISKCPKYLSNKKNLLEK